MTSPTFGVIENLELQAARREQQRENSARPATVSFTYKTSGQGEFTTPEPIPFDVTFTEPPRVTTGVVLDKRPNTAFYRFPQVTCGVYRWDTKKNPVDAAAPSGPGFRVERAGSAAPTSGLTAAQAKRALYVGAYLFFVVTVEPLQPPRTDGSNLAQLQTQLSKETRPVERAALQALIKEAQDALALKANPAKVELTHHLTFTGIALKTVERGEGTSGPDLFKDAVPRAVGN